CDRFESAWKADQRPAIEDYLGRISESERPILFCELLSLEQALWGECAAKPTVDEYIARFPEHAALVREIFVGIKEDRGTGAADPTLAMESPQQEPGDDGHPFPQQIGRYRVDKILGQGGFGLVYLARDEQLSRPVAIKVPHAHLVDRVGAVE